MHPIFIAPESSERKIIYGFFRNLLLCFILLLPFATLAQSGSKLDSLETLFEQETNDSLKILSEIRLSRELHRTKGHDEKEGYDYAQDAIERALQLNDTILYAQALDNFGLLYRYHQHYEQAFDLHAKAFGLVENKEVRPTFKMIFANNAGVAARYNQKYDTSISYYMKALKIAERENDLKDIAIASNGIGNALGNMPDREDEALQYFLRALEAERERENTLGLAMNYLSISDYYIEKGAYKTARDYLTTLLKLNQERQDEFGLAITYEFIGISYMKEGRDLEKATAYFQNALERFEALNNKHKKAQILINLGNIKLKQNQLAATEGYFLESLVLGKELRQYDLIRRSSVKLSQVLEKEKDYKLALHYFKQAESYEDSIKITDQNVKIEALTRKYNIKKKESKIQLLEKDKALQQTVVENQKQQLERRRTIMVLMGIGLFFLLIIFILQYRNYRTKKKTNALIVNEEKEKMNAIYERNMAQAEILVTRLRVNPHFLFNSLNAITYLIQSEQNAKAIKYLKIFSRYTRMVLETSKQHVIPLKEELKLANYYLILEENRFEKDVQFKIEGDESPEINGFVIPPLLLQPFLENAIWHGLLPSECTKKTLDIYIEPKPKGVQVIIDDNGVGRGKPVEKTIKKPHKSMGMQIIKERIELYNDSYSGKISYEIIDKKDDAGQSTGTKIVLTLIQDKSIKTEQKEEEKN